MATMLIDTKLLTDTRVVKLANALNWSTGDALEALLRVWAVCYERELSELSVADIDIAARHVGFAWALVHKGDLGVAVENGTSTLLRVSRARKRARKRRILERARAYARACARTRGRAPARFFSFL